jgi:hypothetical protein
MSLNRNARMTQENTRPTVFLKFKLGNVVGSTPAGTMSGDLQTLSIHQHTKEQR